MGINVLSLFDGISCGMIALERANIKVDNYYSSEIEKSAIEISNENYPDIIRLGDITKIDDYVLCQLPKIDLILAGSPCQGFSRNGGMLNFSHPQSKLFFDFLRILEWIKENNNEEVKFLLENVEMKKEWKNVITEYVKVKPLDINSNLLSAQNRPRTYWSNIEGITIPEDANIKLIDVLDYVNISNFKKYQNILVDNEFNKKELDLINVINGEVRISQATKQGYIVANNGDGVNLSFPNSKTRRGRVIKQKTNTLDKSCNICVYHNGVLRKLTIDELEKLQTLPVGYTDGVSESKRRAAIGNGWTVDIIVHILRKIQPQQNKEEVKNERVLIDVNRKKCPKCKNIKNTSEFYKNKSKKDGMSVYCKQCIKIDSHEYYQRNKEVFRERLNKWRNENRDYVRIRDRKYREENPNIEYRKQKKYRENHKEKLYLKGKKYRQGHRDYFNNKYRERKLKEKEVSDGSITIEFEKFLFDKQEGKCDYCGCDLNESGKHLDHIIPISKGGLHTAENVHWTCPTCNLSKGSKMEDEWLTERIS